MYIVRHRIKCRNTICMVISRIGDGKKSVREVVNIKRKSIRMVSCHQEMLLAVDGQGLHDHCTLFIGKRI